MAPETEHDLPDQATAKKIFDDALTDPKHHDPRPGQTTQNDPIDDREGELGPPDWHKEGRKAPHGWKQVGDTFERG